MGKLYRRPNSPYWWARWQDARGATRRESTRSGDREVARLFLSAREGEVIREQAGIPTAKPVRLARAVAEYLADRRPPAWSERWWDTVSDWWHARLIDDLGGPNVAVSSATRRHVEIARRRWLDGSDELRPVKPPTVNRLTAVGSGFYRWAIRVGYALENPFAGFEQLEEPAREPPAATEADLAAFLAAIPSPVLRRAATVELDTGLRRSELQRLHARDVDHRRRRLLVASSYERGLTKTGKPRVVPLTARAYEAIQAQQEARPGPIVFGRLPDYRNSLRVARTAAGLAHVRWHDLRHYALTRAADAGALGHDLKALAGWKSLAMADRYIHGNVDRVQAVIDRLGQCAPGVQEKRLRKAKRGEKRHTRRAEMAEKP